MLPTELRAAGRLGGRAFAGLVSSIEHVHNVVASRAFLPAGPAGAPARLVHDRVARAVYWTIRGAGDAAGTAAGQVASLLAADDRPAGCDPGGNLAIAALNAAVGDRLGPDLMPLTIAMAVRADGHDVELTNHQVAAVFPAATERLAVFVHGLGETECSWRRDAEQSAPYGSRLQTEFGYTPVYVRFNTGRHISDSGEDLARLLERLVQAWPVPVQEILLVGHSMGGLVIRSACHYGQGRSAPWAARIRHVFYLGSPHLGAPLARAAGLAGRVLGQLPETVPLAGLASGSAGVRDLRHGYLLDQDWLCCDQQYCRADHRSDTPLLAGANHYVISATIAADAASPIGTVVGDLLVQPGSAHGRRGTRQHIGFLAEHGRTFGRLHHFNLLNHPAVWQAMRDFLAEAGPAQDPGGAG